jgi:hypothetical protein
MGDRRASFFDFAVAFPARHLLMNLRTTPDFTPSPEAYAPAVAVMDDFVARMARRDVHAQDDIELFVAIVGGLVDALLANDPGGTRWSRLLERAVDSYTDNLGITDERSQP